MSERIYFLTGDIGRSGPGLKIFVHESFDFWRHSRAFYESAGGVTVGASQARMEAAAFLPPDVSEIYGQRAFRVWLTPPARAKLRV